MTEIEVLGTRDNTPIYYVYLHRRLDDNSVFYVGKGKKRRAWVKKSRNKHWKHIVEKHGYSVEIYKGNLTESEAFQLEEEQIKFYGLDNLSNMTLGGVSTTGYQHTDETKALLKGMVKKRLEDNPELKEQLTNRIMSVVLAPDHYEKLAQINKARFENMNDEERARDIAKRTAWTKDPERLAKSIKKRSESLTEEDRQRLSENTKNFWNKMTEDERKSHVKYMYQKLRESDNYKNTIEAVSNKIVVNGKYLFNSQITFTNFTGKSTGFSYSKSSNKFPFTAFCGYIVEPYDENLHTNVTTDYSDLRPLYDSHGLNKCIKRSDGVVFYGLKQAAESIEGYTTSTADWISRCMSNNKPAFNYNWKVLTNQEISDHILSIIRNNKEE
jgi:hypothetical protein